MRAIFVQEKKIKIIYSEFVRPIIVNGFIIHQLVNWAINLQEFSAGVTSSSAYDDVFIYIYIWNKNTRDVESFNSHMHKKTRQFSEHYWKLVLSGSLGISAKKSIFWERETTSRYKQVIYAKTQISHRCF